MSMNRESERTRSSETPQSTAGKHLDPQDESDVMSDPDEWFYEQNRDGTRRGISEDDLSDRSIDNDRSYPTITTTTATVTTNSTAIQRTAKPTPRRDYPSLKSPSNPYTEPLIPGLIHIAHPRYDQYPHVPTPPPDLENKKTHASDGIVTKRKAFWKPWTHEEEEIVVGSAKAGLSWHETMTLLPGKSQSGARSKQQELRKDGRLDKDLPSRPHITTTSQDALDSIVLAARSAAIPVKSAEDEKKARTTFAFAQGQAEAKSEREAGKELKTLVKGHNKAIKAQDNQAKAKRQKLDHNWTEEQDEEALKLWFAMLDDRSIAKEIGGKNEKMVNDRRRFLTYGTMKKGEKSGPSAIYSKVMAEFRKGV